MDFLANQILMCVHVHVGGVEKSRWYKFLG